MEIENCISNSEEETIDIGSKFAKRLKIGDIVAIYGPLGSGKTEFIKGICDYFKVEQIVTSPTFTIMNQYEANLDGEDFFIYHIDLYRIKNPQELSEIGFNDCMYSSDSIKLVEWADKAEDFFPKNHYEVKIIPDDNNPNKRVIKIELHLPN